MKRIGIYAGHIPSTTFIENLLLGIASRKEFQLTIIGVVKKRVDYPSGIQILALPSSHLLRIPFVTAYFIRSFMLKPQKTLRLAKYLLARKKGFYSTLWDACLALPILLNPPDLFHLQWTKSIVNFSWLVDLKVCATVVSLRGSHLNYSPYVEKGLKEIYQDLFPRLGGFHAVCYDQAKKAQVFGAESAKIHVIYSIVNNHLPEKYSTDILFGSDKLKLLSVGRFHWTKGYTYAIEAVRLLIQKGLEVDYTIVASGDVPEEILTQINDPILKDKVKIMNELPHDKVVTEMQRHSLFILSSVEEGIANVVLEAMAVGLPVITTDCGGMSEVISHGHNGWIVPRRDPQAIAEVIEDFLKLEEATLSGIRKNAHEFIRNNFHEQKQVEKFCALYRNVIKSSQRPPSES